MANKSVLGKLLFSREPKLPENVRLELGDEQKKSVKGNQEVLPATQELATDINRFNQDQLNASMEEASPGFRDLRKSQRGIIASQLMGEIPEDVQSQIQNQAAARSLGGGYGSSGIGNMALARNLGLTSLEMQAAGMGNADRWMEFGRRSLMAPQYDVTSAFVTPMQQYTTDRAEENQQWNWQWMKNQMDAAPKGWEQAVDQIATSLESSAMSYAGGQAKMEDEQGPPQYRQQEGWNQGTGETRYEGNRMMGQGNDYYMDRSVGGAEALGYDSGWGNNTGGYGEGGSLIGPSQAFGSGTPSDFGSGFTGFGDFGGGGGSSGDTAAILDWFD